jgi:hypothetical protein
MYRIQRFNVMKTATVAAVMYMVVVAIFVVPFLLLFAFAGAAGSSQAQTGLGGILVLGLFAVFGYGIFGWIFTAVACLIYNAVAAWIGGIEVKVELVTPPPPPPAWMAATPPPSPPASA